MQSSDSGRSAGCLCCGSGVLCCADGFSVSLPSCVLPAVQSQSASLGVVAGICQVLLALWKVLGSCSVLQVEAVLQNVLLRLADGEWLVQQGKCADCQGLTVSRPSVTYLCPGVRMHGVSGLPVSTVHLRWHSC